jgi:hypothetical protein
MVVATNMVFSSPVDLSKQKIKETMKMLLRVCIANRIKAVFSTNIHCEEYFTNN